MVTTVNTFQHLGRELGDQQIDGNSKLSYDSYNRQIADNSVGRLKTPQ